MPELSFRGVSIGGRSAAHHRKLATAENQVEVHAALKSWRDGLVGLTRQSALIKFRAARTSTLLINSPAPDVVMARLLNGRPQVIRGDVNFGDPDALPESPPNAAFFHSPRPESEVGPVVRNLMRKAQAEFLDRGPSVLYVAFGVLDWLDDDGTQMPSPLLLLPVALIPEGPKGTPRIEVSEDGAVLNPALRLRLNEFGIALPSNDDLDGLTVSEAITSVRSSLEGNETFKAWNSRTKPPTWRRSPSQRRQCIETSLKTRQRFLTRGARLHPPEPSPNCP